MGRMRRNVVVARIRRALGVLVALLTLGASVRAGEWVQVARDGQGDPTRLQVDAVALLGEHVWIAVHQAATFGDISMRLTWSPTYSSASRRRKTLFSR